MRLLLFCVFCVVFLTSTRVFTQRSWQFNVDDYSVILRTWDNRDGLPSWHVVDFIQDHRDYIWLVSELGLTRFDGKNFKHYNYEDHAFKMKPHQAIAEDVNGMIWLIGSNDKDRWGIEIFDPYTEKIYSTKDYLGQNISFSKNALGGARGLYRMRDKIWVLSGDGFGGYFDGKWHTVLQDKKSKGKFQQYMPRKDNLLWVYESPYKLNLIKNDGEIIQSIDLPAVRFHTFWVDEAYKLWLVAPNSPGPAIKNTTLYSIEKNKLRKEIKGKTPPTSWGNTEPGGQGEATLSTNGFEMYLDSLGYSVYVKGKKLNINLDKEVILRLGIGFTGAIFKDKSDHIWFRNIPLLLQMGVQKRKFKNYLTDAENSISCKGMITLNKDSLVVCSYTGVYLVNLKTGAYKPLNFLHNRYNGVKIIRRGHYLWMAGHDANLVRFDLNTFTPQLFKFSDRPLGSTAHTLLPMGDSSMLVGADNGLYKLTLKSSPASFEPVRFRDTTVHFLYKNSSGIWACTNKGLFLFNHQFTKALKHFFPEKPYQPAPNIYHLYEDKQGIFWMATGDGFAKWQPFSDKMHVFQFNQLYPDRRTHCIYPDSRGYLWITSNLNLICFNPKTNKICTFYVEDGLPSNEFNSNSHYQDKKGNLYLGGINGMISFHPDSIDVDNLARIDGFYLNSITLFGRKDNKALAVNPQKLDNNFLKIAPNINRIELSFSAPEYDGKALQYEWRILGQGALWTKLDVPTLQLLSLPYGLHHLELRVSNLGSILNTNKVIKLDLFVKRPITATIWFRLFMLILFFGGAYLFYQWRVSYLSTQNLLLQEKVDKKTQELVNKSILIENQANQIKYDAAQKNKMFIDINHELRTPLTLIQWYIVEVFKLKGTPQGVLELLKNINNNSKKLINLAEEVLVLASLDKLGNETYEANILLAPYVNKIFASFQDFATSKGINYQLRYDLKPDTVVILDANRLEKIINNLIGNAIKYSSQNSMVELALSRTNEWLQIQISDTGIGINEENLNRIFERFYRESNDKNGFGVGLSLVNEYVQRMGGVININSLEGQGTTVKVQVPFKMGSMVIDNSLESLPNAQFNPPIEVNLSDQERLLPFNGAPILLVEDNHEMRNYLQGFLAQWFNVHVAENGLIGLDHILNNPYDLVISDIMMPEMDGFELLENVRKNSQTQLLPFLMLTALAESTYQLKALRLGVDGYIAKPFSTEELLLRIINLLENLSKRKLFLNKAPLNNSRSTSSAEIQDLPFANKWLQELEVIVNAKITAPGLKVQDIAHEMAMSERTLRDRIREYTGLSPQQYILEARLAKAQRLLENKVYLSVAEVSYAVGIQTPSYFSKVYLSKYGRLPSDFL